MTDETIPPKLPNTPRNLFKRFGAWLDAVPERKAWLAAVIVTGLMVAAVAW